MGRKITIKYLVHLCIIVFFISGIFTAAVFASETDGAIDNTDKYAWGENIGWLNFGTTEGNVHITDSVLTGYIWGENIGWISLNCSNDSTCGAVDYKVSNDNEGNLSGYAWSENAGWINFNPAYGGVNIDSSGDFSGYAWGENIGWIIFNCSTTGFCGTMDYKVATDWRPASSRTTEEAATEAETEGLEVSEVKSSSTTTTITIKWKTNNNANEHVRYGINQEMSKEKDDNEKSKSHKMTLKNLNPDTTYYFRIRSKDNNDSEDRSRIHEIKTKKEETVSSAIGLFGVTGDGNEDQKSKSEEEETVFDKVNEITEKIKEKMEETKFFNSEVFKKDEKKYLKEVRFQIKNKQGVPIPNLRVTLHSDPKTAITNQSGIAVFDNIETGRHSLKFSYNGKSRKYSV